LRSDSPSHPAALGRRRRLARLGAGRPVRDFAPGHLAAHSDAGARGPGPASAQRTHQPLQPRGRAALQCRAMAQSLQQILAGSIRNAGRDPRSDREPSQNQKAATQTHASQETGAPSMTQHKIVSREEWISARKALLAKEKQFMKLADELNAEKRALPWE